MIADDGGPEADETGDLVVASLRIDNPAMLAPAVVGAEPPGNYPAFMDRKAPG